MIENAWVGCTCDEATGFKDLGVTVFPYLPGVAGAVNAPDLTSDKPWMKTEFFWERHVDRSLRHTIEVCLSDIHKADA